MQQVYQDDIQFMVFAGQAMMVGYYGSERVLEVPQSIIADGSCYEVTHIARRALYYATCEEIILPRLSGGLAEGAIESCYAKRIVFLAPIDLPKRAVQKCRSLTEVVYPAEWQYRNGHEGIRWVPAKEAFYQCSTFRMIADDGRH